MWDLANPNLQSLITIFVTLILWYYSYIEKSPELFAIIEIHMYNITPSFEIKKIINWTKNIGHLDFLKFFLFNFIFFLFIIKWNFIQRTLQIIPLIGKILILS